MDSLDSYFHGYSPHSYFHRSLECRTLWPTYKWSAWFRHCDILTDIGDLNSQRRNNGHYAVILRYLTEIGSDKNVESSFRQYYELTMNYNTGIPTWQRKFDLCILHDHLNNSWALHLKVVGFYRARVHLIEGQLEVLLFSITELWSLYITYTTRNTFCGMWYLPHSQVHNERTVPIIMAGCITHAQNGRISTSGLKSDVTVVFLDPDFLQGGKISAIRKHLRKI